MFKKKSAKMKKSLLLFKKAEFDSAKYVSDFYLDYGKAYISVRVSSIDQLVSKFSIKEYEWINPEFAEYIVRNAYYIPVEYKIVLEIYGKFNKEEKKVIIDTIKDFTGLRLGDKQIKLETNTSKSLSLLFFGIISLLLFFFLNRMNLLIGLTEIFSIIVWFAIWEFFGMIVFDRAEIKKEKLNAAQLAMCEIIFNEK